MFDDKFIIYGNIPLQHFVKKSFENLKLKNQDFAEIHSWDFFWKQGLRKVKRV